MLGEHKKKASRHRIFLVDTCIAFFGTCFFALSWMIKSRRNFWVIEEEYCKEGENLKKQIGRKKLNDPMADTKEENKRVANDVLFRLSRNARMSRFACVM